MFRGTFMNRLILASALLAALGAGRAEAHQLFLDCFEVREGVIACRSDYSTGEPATGAAYTLYSEKNVELGRIATDNRGVTLFKAPPEDYVVVVTTGAAHVASLASTEISSKPHRPGWGGDWVEPASVDRLAKLRDWQSQFLADKAPLVKRAEEEIQK